jgi:hypothetical protein
MLRVTGRREKSAISVVQRSIVAIFFEKEKKSCSLARKKASLEVSPTLGRSEYI